MSEHETVSGLSEQDIERLEDASWKHGRQGWIDEVNRHIAAAHAAGARAVTDRVEALAENGHRFVGMNCECGHELNSPAGWVRHLVRAALSTEGTGDRGTIPDPGTSSEERPDA